MAGVGGSTRGHDRNIDSDRFTGKVLLSAFLLFIAGRDTPGLRKCGDRQDGGAEFPEDHCVIARGQCFGWYWSITRMILVMTPSRQEAFF